MRKIGRQLVSAFLVVALLTADMDYTGLVVCATENTVETEAIKQEKAEESAEETEQEQSEFLKEIVDEVEAESYAESEVVDFEKNETERNMDEEAKSEGIGKEATETELVTTEEVDVLENGEVLSGKCGDNLTWTLVNGVLTISGTGEMYNYEYISNSELYRTLAPWGEYNGTIKQLVLEEGITTIGRNAFLGCDSFQGNLIIPDSVISIGLDAFSCCRGFNGSIVLGKNVTTIESSAFSACNGLVGSLTISNKVESIGSYAFRNCSGLDGVLIIPNSVRSIGSGAFEGCSGLKGNLTIPNSITRIESYVFNGCSGFDGNLTIPDSVISIGGNAFNCCNGLTGNLIIPNSVTSIEGGAFSDCSGFSGSLIIPDSVTSLGNAFSGCSGFDGDLIIGNGVKIIEGNTFDGCSFNGNLKMGNNIVIIKRRAFWCRGNFAGDLIIPNSVVTIEREAFSGCNFNGNLIIGNGVEVIESKAFESCNFNGSLTIGKNVTTIGERAFISSVFDGNLIIPDNVIKLGDQAFNSCTFNGNLTIGKGITRIPSHVFYNCNGFSGNLIIPDNVIIIDDGAFRNCNSFDGNIVISESVTTIEENAFNGCNGFTGDLTIPDSVTTIEENAFSGCSGFTGDLTIGDGITTIGLDAFSGCSGFTGNLKIGNGITKIDSGMFGDCKSFTGTLTIGNSVTTIGDGAFKGCSDFSGNLIIPDSVTSIGRNAFNGCSGFSGNLTIPDSVEMIGDSAFSGCNGFSGNLTISDSITTIGESTFYGCNGLSGNLIIPDNVTVIGNSAFSGCSGFSGDLTISDSVTMIGNSTFYGCSGLSGNLIIPDNVTVIEGSAFSGCSGFNGGLVIGDGVTTIKSNAFFNCDGIENIYFKGKTPEIDNYGVFGNITVKVYYPSDMEGWESIANQNYGGTLTWISYPSGTKPWLMEGSDEGIPRYIWPSISSDILDLNYDVESGYNIEEFNLSIYAYFMGGVDDIDKYEDVNIVVELPQGLSFSKDKEDNKKTSILEIMDSTTNSLYKESYPIYITANDLIDRFEIITKVTAKKYKTPQTYTYSIIVSKKKPDYSPSDIESITQTDKVEDTAYSIIKYEPTIEGRIRDLVIDYNTALNDYLDAVKISAERDLNQLNSGTSNIAAKLREADDVASNKNKVILMDAGIPKDALDSVYEALVMYLDDCTQTGIKLGKIDPKKSSIEIGINIVNKVQNSINKTTFTKKIGQYTVTFNTLEVGVDDKGTAYTGSVLVAGKKGEKYTGLINAPAKKTAELMTLYINDLSDTVRDLLKSALMSVFTELSDTMGISVYTKKKLNSLLKDKVELLEKNGYGDVLKNTIKLRDTYELINDIIAAQNATDLQEALSKASSIQKKIKNLDYSDDGITKAIIRDATDKLNNINKNLELALDEYINGTKSEDKSFWGWFKKIFIECPVDLIVYDMNDNVLGYVDNGVVSYDEKILIRTSGDVKTLYVPADMEVKLKFLATGNGSMDYVIEEVQDNKITGRINYYNIPLIVNETYFQTLTTDSLMNDVEMFPIKKSDGTTIYANEYISASDKNASIVVDCSAEAGGIIIGNGKYPKGDPVELLAFGVDDTYEFCGWYVNDTLVELNNVYRFASLENVSVYAKFKKNLIVSSEYKIVLENFYDDFAWVDVYENEANSEDVVMRLQGAEDIKDFEAVNIKRYLAGGQCLSNRVDTEFDNRFSFWVRGVALKECIKTEIYDGSNRLIVTISQNGNENGCTVSFDTQNRGNAPADYIGIAVGSIIAPPEEPTAEHYIFLGWFKDAACTVPWDFSTDTVESDITLYAGWKEDSDDSDSNLDDDFEGVLPEDIPADGIPQGLWIAGVKDYIYTGKAIKPEVRVYDGEKRLKEKTDYTISYKSNTKANDASVEKTAPTIVVKGKGNYGGTETAVFKILPVDLNDANITVDDITLAFNNKVQKPIPVVVYNGKKLKNKTDFIISYPELESGNPNALKETGTYSLVISAKKDAKGNDTGNFIGTRTLTFDITDRILIGKVAVKTIPNKTYTGTTIEPQLQVTYKNSVLTQGTDYEVSYLNNTEIGTATVILTGINQYAGIKKVTYRIIGKSIKNAVVGATENITYDGTAKCPKPQVSMDGIILEEGTDYKINWQNNTNAGKATITISGIKKYSGTLKKTFRITAYDLQQDIQNKISGFNSEITEKYAKGGSRPDIELVFNGTKLTVGKDYTISYKNNKQVASRTSEKPPTIVITGKGNFKGRLSKNFTVTKKAFDDVEVPVKLMVADIRFVDKAGKYISKPILTDFDGKKLTAGVDYEKDIQYTLTDGTMLTKEDKVEAGREIILKVTGKGAYTGELTKTYRITKSDFGKAKIVIQTQTYTGKAITLDASDITVRIGDTTLTYGTDYEVLSGSYANNIKKGNASVTIVGKGSYGGTKTVKFKIAAKKVSWFWRLFG